MLMVLPAAVPKNGDGLGLPGFGGETGASVPLVPLPLGNVAGAVGKGTVELEALVGALVIGGLEVGGLAIGALALKGAV